MGVYKIRQLALFGLLAVVIIGLLLFGILHKHTQVDTAITTIPYTEQISGVTGTYYANKAPEVQATGSAFVNSNGLAQQLGDAKFSVALSILRKFTDTQSHYLARQPVLSNITTNGDVTKLSLFIDSNEQFYTVTLDFSQNPTTPTVAYEVGENDTIK